jgi:hypothetical protein
MPEEVFIVSGVPGNLVRDNDKFTEAPTATFSDKNIPTIGKRLKLTEDVLSTVIVPLSKLPPEVFNPKFPPIKTCPLRLKLNNPKNTIITILTDFIYILV